MKREQQLWLAVFLLGAAGLAIRVAMAPDRVGTVYVAAQPPAEPQTDPSKPVRYQEVGRGAPNAVLSIERTIGVWLAAIMTLGVLSYLYRDNPLYKLAESVVVGVSAGYSFVVGFWEILVDKLMLKLTPELIDGWLRPLSENEQKRDWWALIPLILGVLVFFRFVPKLGWLAVWPLAFVVGLTAGLKLIVFIEADFIGQIQNTMLPFLVVVTEEATKGKHVDYWQSLKNVILVLGVITSLTYFYFSVEHKGLVGGVARCGVWVLMITFGSSFAMTVMGRITLLTVRLEFLLGRWLGLIDASQ